MNKNQFYLISFCVFLAVCNEINTNGTILNKTNETHLDVFEKEIEILEETINLYKRVKGSLSPTAYCQLIHQIFSRKVPVSRDLLVFQLLPCSALFTG